MKKSKGGGKQQANVKDGRYGDDPETAVAIDKTPDFDSMIKANLEGILSSDDFIERLWSKFTDKLEFLMTGIQQKFIEELKINEIKQENSDLKRENGDLKQRLKDLEQYPKMNPQVEIQGIPVQAKEENQNNSTNIVLQPGKALALEFRPSDGCRCARPPGIILKFAPRSSRHRSSDRKKSKKSFCNEMCVPSSSGPSEQKECPRHKKIPQSQ